MKQVRQHIKDRQSRFGEIKFFDALEQYEATSTVGALSFIRGLTFFVMAFQDILRLNEEQVKDRELHIIARHHRLEDKGHDVWFLHDLQEVDGNLPDVGEIFSSAHTVTRDTAYRLIGEVFKATDDRTNIALLLVLESTGHVFFNRVVEFLERIEDTRNLYYFARGHLDIELGHELFEKRMDAVIDAIDLTDAERATVLKAVDNSFDAMTGMLENLTEQVKFRSTMPPVSFESVPPVSAVIPKFPAMPRSKRKLMTG
jgi:hypothetical protein